jgi:hypothetical protein
MSSGEIASLIGLGTLTMIFLCPLLVQDYSVPHLRSSLIAVIAACLIYPACILAFTRKAIAQRNGDWKILLFVLLFNYALFWLIASGSALDIGLSFFK